MFAPEVVRKCGAFLAHFRQISATLCNDLIVVDPVRLVTHLSSIGLDGPVTAPYDGARWSEPLFEACYNKEVQAAIKHRAGIRRFDIGSQIFDTT
jgi:hypothetical protein